MQPVYTLTDIRQIYESRTVLNLPSLDVQAGEILALVGPSGAGKSTLLRLMALLESPSQGTLSVNLNDRAFTYHSATIHDRRRLTMVFQRPILLSRKVRANVAYGLQLRRNRNGKQRIDEVLERVSMHHLADAKPHTLSGGEMQRVAIARALVLKPDILLLDEPTANLDPYNVKVIEQFLKDEHERYQPTIVIVTHNVFQAKRLATRMALLLEGELIETGTPEQFFESPQDSRTAAFMSGDLIY